MSSPSSEKRWQFLTSHAQVLLCLHNNPEVRLRDIAESVGITERAAQRIVTDLAGAGYVTRTRVGRRNRYEIDPSVAMRHPSQYNHQVGELLELLGSAPPSRAGRARRSA